MLIPMMSSPMTCLAASLIIEAMREVAYDLSTHRSKSLDELPDVEFDFVATMGCGDKCPWIRARKRADWALPDPKHLSPDYYRAVRNQICESVRAMLLDLGVAVAVVKQ